MPPCWYLNDKMAYNDKNEVPGMFGSVNLLAVRGASFVFDEFGRKFVQIPVDVGRLNDNGKACYLPIFMMKKPKFGIYDWIILESQSKDERETGKKAIIYGNAGYVRFQNKHQKPGSQNADNKKPTEGGEEDFGY